MTHHSARFLFAALFSAATVLSIAGNAPAQQTPLPPSKSMSPSEYDAFLTARLLDTTAKSVKSRHSISDDELMVISDIVHKPSLPVSLKAEALKPLSYLDSMSITPKQKDKLNTLIGEVLRADDMAQDASGSMKVYALGAVQRIPGNTLASDVRALKDDKREPVRTMVRRMMGYRK